MESEFRQFHKLFDDIYDQYGYDFRDYAIASLERRVDSFLAHREIDSYEALRQLLLKDEALFSEFLMSITVQVTEMFRDPPFYKCLREDVLPVLATYPRLKIWHAGCSSGEEVYSVAILLHEAGLLNRTLLYATDINEAALKQANLGCFALKDMKVNTQNYIASGGQASFSEYFKVKGECAQMMSCLRERMVYSFHNLAVDSVFAEVQMVICRNVFIYFNCELQQSVLGKFSQSLGRRGFIALGDKEYIGESLVAENFKEFIRGEKIYRKIS